MIHLNGNVMAVVDTETTGLQPFHNDVIQVCVLPLDSDFKPLQGILPFYCELQPRRPENYDAKAAHVTKMELCKIQQTGLEPDRAADLFEEWFERLGLPHGKMLVPLAHNWPFDYCFMLDWLGWSSMNRYFHGHYRDLQMAGCYENDKAAFNVQTYPYPKHGLQYYCSQLGVENQNAHDALSDCVATAECYRRVVKAGMFTPVQAQPESL
jgi:DNA polymerase III epsilon subunit-like protein